MMPHPGNREPGVGRRWAQVWMSLAVRIAPAECRVWAEAMRAELEYVEGDWKALWWAVGGFTAMVRRAGQDWIEGEMERRREETRMQNGRQQIGWALLGALGTVLLSLTALGLLFAVAVLHPQLGLDHAEWTHVLFVIVLPLAISLGAAVWLWRRRRPAAIGILLAAVAMGTHVALHFATR